MKKLFILLIISITFFSCGTMRQLTPAEIKMMTTKQIEADYDIVFVSAISLLQSEGFLVSNTDKETGLINASKQVENQTAVLEKFLWGSAVEANTAQIAFFIQKINERLTEVKLTIYEGSISSTIGGFGVENTKSTGSMVQDAQVYNNWFNSLRAEVERRKAME